MGRRKQGKGKEGGGEGGWNERGREGKAGRRKVGGGKEEIRGEKEGGSYIEWVEQIDGWRELDVRVTDVLMCFSNCAHIIKIRNEINPLS